MHIPDKNHAHAEQLIAVNHKSRARPGQAGKIYLYGYSKLRGGGSAENLRDIAVRLNNGKYLLKDEVPINRLVWNKKVEDSNDWFKHLVEHRDRDRRERQRIDASAGVIRLADPIEEVQVRERFD